MSTQTRRKLFRVTETIFKSNDKHRAAEGDIKARMELFVNNYEAIYNE